MRLVARVRLCSSRWWVMKGIVTYMESLSPDFSRLLLLLVVEIMLNLYLHEHVVSQ